MRGSRLLPGPSGELEVLTVGRGEPHSLFVHGLGGSIQTTRPYATKVVGTRTFMHLRGHGASEVPTGSWGYAELASDIWTVADAVRADRALGISAEAGALLAGLSRHPDRFARLVLVVPAVLDQPRDDAAMESFAALADEVSAGDLEAVAASLLRARPAPARSDPAVVAWSREQAGVLVATGAPLVTTLRTLPGQTALTDRAALEHVRCPVLVLGQEGDDAHPEQVAREVAESLPEATLHLVGPDGIMWGHRRETRDLVGEFLSVP